MAEILLINPNTSAASLEMMLGVARGAGPGLAIRGVCAETGPSMIVDAAQLAASAAEVVRLGRAAAGVSVIIVAAFGDPGVAELRGLVDVPVIGIGEASVREAAAGGRRFGIATTTPELVAAMGAMVERLGVAASFTGVRLADGDPLSGDPLSLAAHPAAQEQALAAAVAACVERDGAEAVIIGGGPLSDAARALRDRLAVAIIEPVPAAVRLAGVLAGQPGEIDQ